jgi:hypothetical protein
MSYALILVKKRVRAIFFSKAHSVTLPLTVHGGKGIFSFTVRAVRFSLIEKYFRLKNYVFDSKHCYVVYAKS